MKLTKSTVAKLQVPPGKSELIAFDAELPGFGVRLRAGGKRTWIAQYRLGTKQRRMTLGTLETVDEGEARRRAKAALAKVHLGLDPQTEKAEARAQAAITLGSVVDRYLERAAPRLRPRSLVETRRYLQRDWAPLSELPLAKIGRKDVAARLNTLAQEGGPIAANRARATLSTLFSWAIGEGLADANPVIGTRSNEEVRRERVLSDEELGLIWRHARDGDYGAIVRLLILTGQRREEVGGMHWSEIDLDKGLWALESERTKNRKRHDVPLSDLATAIVEGLPRRGERDLLFGLRDGPFKGWARAKGALDGRLETALRDKRGDKAVLVPWRLHDIRRTVATRMAELGVLPHVVEAVLNHISGHKAGVAGVYNRASYAGEKRAALTLWAERVKVLSGQSSNVVAMKRSG
jgi:integrase